MRPGLPAGLFIVLVSVSTVSGIAQTWRRSIAELPGIRQLPDPFTFVDGSSVRSRADWVRRREELKGLFQDYVYGSLPSRPERMTIRRAKWVADDTSNVTLQDLELALGQEGRTLTLDVRIALPSNAGKKVPVIVQGAFPPGFDRPDSSAATNHFLRYTSRGYAVAELNFQQIAPDDKERARTGGVYELFGEEADCGTLMAWAWGIQRVIDALETVPEIDAARVIVTGHSRYGKAALIAGAFDERIALTVPSHSGCAGVAPFRFNSGKSEQLHNIVGFAPYWFRRGFDGFVGNVYRLPVDQHLLIALVAPRALLSTEGTRDAWTNPEGAQLTHKAAGKVYEFLGAGHKLSIRYRPAGHVPSIDDLLAYAEDIFFGKELSEGFGQFPYKDEPAGFMRDVPK